MPLPQAATQQNNMAKFSTGVLRFEHNMVSTGVLRFGHNMVKFSTCALRFEHNMKLQAEVSEADAACCILLQSAVCSLQLPCC